VEHLVGRGDSVVVLDDLSSGRRANLARVADSPGVRFVEGSILDAPLVDELTAEVDHVFHLAAAVGVKLINEDPMTSLRVNLHGTETVFEAAARHRRPVLLASTSEVYGKNYDAPLRETDDRVLGSPWKSKWSYSEAKAIDEFLGYVLWERTGLPVVIVRLFNTVGPRQIGRYGMVLPNFVDQARTGRDLTVYGDGQQSRCFCHVSDVVPAIVALSTKEEAYGKAVNLGGSEETTIADLAKRVITLTGSTSGITHVPYEEAYLPGFEDVQRRVPCTDLARELIGFVPAMDLDAIVRSVAEDRARAAEEA
jgi:UDP-glucose 4-epimerase